MLQRLKQLSQRTRLLIAGSVAFVIFLPLFAPAYLVAYMLPGDNIGMSGISGSLWNGSAQRISVNSFVLNATRWQVEPLALLRGGMKLHVVTSWAGGEFEGNVRAGITGALSVSDASVFASLNELSRGLALQLAGQLSLVIDEITLVDEWPTKLVATLNIRGLTAPQPGSAKAALVGDYTVVFANVSVDSENPVLGEVTDSGGPLDVKGTITLEPPRQYLLDLKVEPQANTPKALIQGLQFMAPADNRGVHNLKLSSGF